MHKVLVDLHRLGGNRYNGLYHYCYHLGSQLSVIDQQDIELSFYLPKTVKHIFGKNANYEFQKRRDKFFHLDKTRFNVWHVTTTLSWYRPFSHRTKNVFTIHDLNFLNEEEYNGAAKKKYLKLVQQRVNRADHLTYISNFALQQAKEHLDIGSKPYSIIHNGCNIEVERVGGEPFSKPAAPFLFTIGQLHTRKNFHVLPALLVNNDYELIIAGLNEFPYAQKVIHEARKLGVADRVKLIGPISEQVKYWYYQNCLAFVFPSIGEGFGLPVIEAMHFGKPVFLSAFTSLPEVGGKEAYYFGSFEPASMRDVFEKGMHDYLANNKTIFIKKHAAGFDWKLAAQKYLDVYKSLL